MPTHADIDRLIDAAAGVRAAHAFNPYADVCPDHDRSTAAEIRQDNLRAILRAVGEEPIDQLWLALEPTWKGGRRTGLAMTDDRHLVAHAERWNAVGVERATTTAGPAEQTAGHVWKALEGLPGRRIFLWNAVFLHTHLPGDYRKDRNHNAAEAEACRPILLTVLGLLRPRRCVAIGVAAQKALAAIGQTSTRVRHPSNAGHLTFAAEVRTLNVELFADHAGDRFL